MDNHVTKPVLKADTGIVPRLHRVWTMGRRLVLYRLYSWLAFIRLRVNGVQVGRGLRVYGWLDLEIHPLAKAVVGDHVRINSGFALNPVGGYRRTGIWVGKHATLQIEDNVGISNCTIVCMTSVTIENDVFIGGDCRIYDTDFHPIEANLRISHQIDKVRTAAIKISHGSFIGSHSLILKGVQIGSEAVIGAGSVVTRNVPSGEIWAGVPARHIGTNPDKVKV